MKTSRCKRCGAAVVMAKTVAGDTIPLDVNVPVYVLLQGDGKGPGRRSGFARIQGAPNGAGVDHRPICKPRKNPARRRKGWDEEEGE